MKDTNGCVGHEKALCLSDRGHENSKRLGSPRNKKAASRLRCVCSVGGFHCFTIWRSVFFDRLGENAFQNLFPCFLHIFKIA